MFEFQNYQYLENHIFTLENQYRTGTSYKKLSRIRREFRDIPIMALTATATPEVQKDICKILRMRKSQTKCFKASFDRPNLRYSVLKKPKKKIEALEMLCKRIKSRHKNQTGIVYCLSRDECSTLFTFMHVCSRLDLTHTIRYRIQISRISGLESRTVSRWNDDTGTYTTSNSMAEWQL